MAEHDAPAKEPRKVALPVIGAGKSKTFLEQADLGDELAPAEGAPAAWIGLGAMMTYAFMVPLSYAGLALLNAFVPRAADPRASFVPLFVISFLATALSSFGGGFMIARFGPKVGPKAGALSGLIAGAGMFTIAMVGEVRAGHGVLAGLSALAIVLVTVPASWLGAKLGRAAKTAAK